MIVLGHDPSLASYGLALVDVEKRELLASAVVRTSPSHERHERLRILFDEIRAKTLAWAKKWDVDRVAFEAAILYGGKSLERGAGSALIVAEARGVGYVTASHFVDVVTISAQTVRKAVVGNGGVQKAQAVEAVKRILVRDEMQDDVADAAAVALAAGGFVAAPFSRAGRSKDDRTQPLPLIQPKPAEKPLVF